MRTNVEASKHPTPPYYSLRSTHYPNALLSHTLINIIAYFTLNWNKSTMQFIKSFVQNGNNQKAELLNAS